MMTTFYTIDAAGVYVSTVQLGLQDRIPHGTEVPPPVGEGFAHWDGGQWSLLAQYPAVPTPVPASVTRRQARQALVLAGKFDLVQAALDAIPDATQRKLMQIEWDDSQVFERNRPSLVALGTAIGLSSSQIDDLFRTAATL